MNFGGGMEVPPCFKVTDRDVICDQAQRKVSTSKARSRDWCGLSSYIIHERAEMHKQPCIGE